jgi:hypothetical protein
MRDQIKAAIAILQDVLMAIDDTEPDMPEEAKKLLSKGICLNCKKPLGDDDHLRGVHRKCFQRIRRNIRDGQLSEAQAIEKGVLASKKVAGRPRITDDALSKVIESQTIIAGQDEGIAQKYDKKSKKPKP